MEYKRVLKFLSQPLRLGHDGVEMLSRGQPLKQLGLGVVNVLNDLVLLGPALYWKQGRSVLVMHLEHRLTL